jgi:hypothetical protein
MVIWHHIQIKEVALTSVSGLLVSVQASSHHDSELAEGMRLGIVYASLFKIPIRVVMRFKSKSKSARLYIFLSLLLLN